MQKPTSWWRATIVRMLVPLYLVVIAGGPFALVAAAMRATRSPFAFYLVLAASPAVYAIAYALIAGMLSRLTIRAVTPGRYPRDAASRVRPAPAVFALLDGDLLLRADLPRDSRDSGAQAPHAAPLRASRQRRFPDVPRHVVARPASLVDRDGRVPVEQGDSVAEHVPAERQDHRAAGEHRGAHDDRASHDDRTRRDIGADWRLAWARRSA